MGGVWYPYANLTQRQAGEPMNKLARKPQGEKALRGAAR